ncbi:MAG: hypothetical protein R3A46_09080 [Thermomicrobiales bacterium]
MINAVPKAARCVSVEISGQDVNGQLTGEFRWTGEELLAEGEPLPEGVDPNEVESSDRFSSTLPFRSDD